MKEIRISFDVRRRKKILEAMIYVRNNLDWIANIPKVKGYGSGPAEKTVDITVALKIQETMDELASGWRQLPSEIESLEA